MEQTQSNTTISQHTNFLSKVAIVIFTAIVFLMYLGLGVQIAEATPYDTSVAYYTGDTFLVGGEETDPEGLEFSSDGTKMYVVGPGATTIFEYSLSTAYDITSATYGASNLLLTAAYADTDPTDLEFNNDGTKMFVIGRISDRIMEFTLSTAWDVTSATYAGAPEDLDISSEEGDAQAMTFSNDGMKLFIVGFAGDSVVEYSLGTAYDVSTATHAGVPEEFSVASEAPSPRGLKFNDDGTKMFITETLPDTVFAYNLGTGFDVSTAVYAGVANDMSASPLNNPQAMAFSSTGEMLFLVNDASGAGSAVYEFSMVTPSEVSITANDDEATENSADAGQFTVTLDEMNNTGSAITVSYSVSGTATSGSDYTALTGSVDVATSATTATIDVITTADDALEEGSETVIVTITGATGGVSAAASPNDNATVTIIDDEESDNDGISNATEDAGPNGGDANGDGFQDSQQANVASQPNSQVGGSYTSVAIDGGTCVVEEIINYDIETEASQSASDSSYDYPAGLHDFTIDCGTPGATVDVKIYIHGSPGFSANNVIARKVNVLGSYTSIPGATITNTTVGGASVILVNYQIVDGGPLDDDGVANGIIVDPSGPAIIVSAPGGGGAEGRRVFVDCKDGSKFCTVQDLAEKLAEDADSDVSATIEGNSEANDLLQQVLGILLGNNTTSTSQTTVPATSTSTTTCSAIYTQDLGIGSTGSQVAGVQRTLTINGFGVGNIDGSFGQLTSTALKNYQVSAGLTPTGVVDAATRSFLNSSYCAQASGASAFDINSITQANEAEAGGSSTVTFCTPVFNTPLSTGSFDLAVREAKVFVRSLGYNVTEISNLYDQQFAEALARLQSRNGLVSDGILGPGTRGFLNDIHCKAVKGEDIPESAYGLEEVGTANVTPFEAIVDAAQSVGSAVAQAADVITSAATGASCSVNTGTTLSRGSTGSSVASLQVALNSLGYSIDVSGGGDGVYGPKTAAAVVQFQSASGLVADGVAGPQTLGAINIQCK